MAATPNFATAADVRIVLGAVGSTVPTDILTEAGISVDAMLPAAHAEVLDRLSEVYGTTLPVISQAATPDAWLVLEWAEARICAANILDILRASLDTESEIPERLRRSAWASIDRGVPGLRPGDPDGSPLPTWTASPAHSSSTPVSNWPNPYGDDVVPDLTAGWSSL